MRVSEQRKRTELELSGVELHLCEFFLRQSFFDILTIAPFLCVSEKEAESVLCCGHIIASLEMGNRCCCFLGKQFLLLTLLNVLT